MIPYRGRLAPTPTGLLHAGHAATFHTVHARARAHGGNLVLRIEDLDSARCWPEYVAGVIEDLLWLGLDWDEGPVFQSARRKLYLNAWLLLVEAGAIYPCSRSRRDVERAGRAPHEEEPIFPTEWRSSPDPTRDDPEGVNWRFRVPDGRELSFFDGRLGKITRVAGRDFGDFVVWNRDGIPAYELAVVVDDATMGITEIVRGEDLLTSTCRQLLIREILGAPQPTYFHCPLVRDSTGRRLAKRDAALGIRALRAAGASPDEVITGRFSKPLSRLGQ